MKFVLIAILALNGGLTSHVQPKTYTSLAACDKAGLALQVSTPTTSYICKKQ